jgi:hypothetical protein
MGGLIIIAIYWTPHRLALDPGLRRGDDSRLRASVLAVILAKAGIQTSYIVSKMRSLICDAAISFWKTETRFNPDGAKVLGVLPLDSKNDPIPPPGRKKDSAA